ncbi:hypothetical protein GmHk_12G034828 [Glycine max]|nr:hypothetical protein GmHk_12G034828 [Glycine max]
MRVVEYPPTAAEELNEEQPQPPVEEGVTNVEGVFHSFKQLHVDDTVDMLVELLETIPPHPTMLSVSVEEIDARWMQFGDPPRALSVQQYDTFVKPDVHKQLVATTPPDEADVDVHRPGHAVDGYVAIADKLERLLNLRILTEGTKAYTAVDQRMSEHRKKLH